MVVVFQSVDDLLLLLLLLLLLVFGIANKLLSGFHDNSMIFLLPLTVLPFLSLAKTLKWTSNPYLIPPMSVMASTQYLVFHGQLALNYTLSRIRCEALGGDLADVDSTDTFHYLHTRLHTPAFIGSFDGKTYGGGESGLALFPGGAVAIPEGGAASRLSSVCEVPLLGTYAIDLRRYGEAADKSVKVGDYSKGNANEVVDGNLPSLEALMRAGFVIHGRRDPRFSGLSAQEEEIGAKGGDAQRALLLKQGTQTSTPTATSNQVTTLTIYGSIETDPALPCCRCCNPI